MKIHLFFVTVATFAATTIATSTSVFVSDDGRSSNNQRRVRKNKYNKKYNKKQNVKKEQTCTRDNFVGEYKYLNCKGFDTKVEITCDDEDGTEKQAVKCKYQEHPLNDEADNMCFVHGSFDPVTHITMDSTRAGICQLEFVQLTYSCADVSPIGFGMKAEVGMTTDHDTSTLLLLFSNDGGSVYYNEEEPRETVFLHHDIPPGRKLTHKDCNRNCDPGSKLYDDWEWGCHTNDCVMEVYKDGCSACMCYKHGGDSWCDGTKNAYYDDYYEKHNENPFGDSDRANRKCNTNFSYYGGPCNRGLWQCPGWMRCLSFGDERGNYETGCYPR